MIVILIIAPVVIHRHTGLPVHAWESRRGNFLLGRAKISDIFALSREPLHSGATLIHPIVDDDARLQLSDVVVQISTVLVIPRVLPLPVEP